jgi:tellurite resistance protein TerC
MTNATLTHWIVFNLMIIGLLAIDLSYFKKQHRMPRLSEILISVIGWFALAGIFNIWVYYAFGKEAALNFLAGFLLEKSLSVDNLFLFLLIFGDFKVPASSKRLVLFYGILGAIIMRALFILGGIALISRFNWIFYVFGVFLIISGFRLMFKKEEEIVLQEERFIYRLFRRFIPLTPEYHNDAFFIKKEGKKLATPLFFVLLLIETTDLIFALDSVPAIFGITTDPFIVYTSNIFAILGLRSLFFILEDVMQRFYLLHYSLAVILIFIGIKMMLANYFHVPVEITLLIIVSLLGIAIAASYLFPQKTQSVKR